MVRDNKKIDLQNRKAKAAALGQRWHGSDLKKIDNWAKTNSVTRSEAILNLFELGQLKTKKKKK
jgi:hypothetical protein